MYLAFSYISIFIVIGCCIYHLIQSKGNFAVSFEKVMSAKGYYIALGLIFALFLVTRFYQLGEVPQGMHIDEFGMAYDAFCLANYKVDRHLVRFPVYLINFGGGQNALYTYLTAIIFKITGFSIINARLAAVFSGMACFFSASLIGKELSGKTKTALIPPILVTILPYFLMSERWGLESHLLPSYLMVFLYFVVKAIKTEKTRYYILAGLFCGITLYTYAICWTILPIFLFLLFIYMIYIKRINVKNTIAFSISLLILAWPLLAFLLVNNDKLPEIKTAFFSIVKVGYRGSEIALSNIRENLGLLKMMVTHGPWEYNAVPKYGTVYVVSIPLIIYGLVISIKRSFLAIKEKKWDVAVLISVLFVSAYFPLMLIAEPNINKINAIYPIFVLLIFFSIQNLTHKIKNIYPMLISIYMIVFVMFSTYYFIEYNNKEYNFFLSYRKWEEIMEFVDEKIEDSDCPIYFYEETSDQHYIWARDLYIRAYDGISPYEAGRYQYENLGSIGANAEAVYILDDSFKGEAEKLKEEGWISYSEVGGMTILYNPS